MAQPRSQRDQNRSSPGNSTNPIATNITSNATNNRGDSFETRMSQANVPFMSQQQNPMSNMMFQRSMGQIPMMGGGMPMMNMNPMAMMGMNMNMQNMNPMANMMGSGMGAMGGGGGMGGMNGMMGGGGMNNMNAMNPMGNPAAMRLGMGPMGGAGSMNPAAAMMGNASGMGGAGAMMQMRPGTNAMAGGMVTPFGRMAANAAGPGPMRLNSRGQHSFHPYSR
ncbi:hypothetical protein BT96DRAFT_202014 [Gymnopus androsaceus JB14]|uniref:Uncharacterized protein n=1 Tax=Gymnopus androsaceus JB14 TaxID=1447944 RepID=A0A6A4H9H1_9AGAR|nr:hypothetical protein BT96DRAFT_202014 [Gymnopus androsaceus JB14]